MTYNIGLSQVYSFTSIYLFHIVFLHLISITGAQDTHLRLQLIYNPRATRGQIPSPHQGETDLVNIFNPIDEHDTRMIICSFPTKLILLICNPPHP